MKETINEDTYQTLKEVEVTPYEKATLPMWNRTPDKKKKRKQLSHPTTL